MQPQGPTYRRERMEEALREEVSIILEGELADPRIGLVTVTEIKLGTGGKSAHIFVSVVGDDDEAEQCMKGLEAAKGYIRRELTDRLALRHCPELQFHLDRSEQHHGRIDTLLTRMEKRKPKTVKAAPRETPEQPEKTPES